MLNGMMAKIIRFQDFTSNPHEYKSKVKKYLLDADMLITGHYWEPKFSKTILSKSN